MSFSSTTAHKSPRLVLDDIYAFPPNRETLGGTAYLIIGTNHGGERKNLLIDAPAWNPENQQFIAEQGGVHQLIITHRGGIGQSKQIQASLNCEVLIQEQKAYLLPQTPVTPFQSRASISDSIQILWTPGHTPGSSCIYYQNHDGVLFTGRHLLPTAKQIVAPLRFAKTFHWKRQLRQVQRLKEEFSPNTLSYFCPGANTGFLRGQRYIDDAYSRLQAIDIDALAYTEPLL